MKLLFDQNLSPRLVGRLADLFPGSQHVQDVGLDQALDEQVWEHARQHGHTIVSKDDDFQDISIVSGNPPKVLLLQLGNCSTQQVENSIRSHLPDIESFEQEDSVGVLLLQ